MTPHRKWFFEYEKYNGNVFLGDDSPKNIMGCGRVKLLLNDGRIRTLPSVLHIPDLAGNLISVSKMDDAGVKTVFEKDKCKMIREAMVLMRGVQYGTLYKLLGKIVIDECNNTIVPETRNKENNVPNVSGGEAMLWHQRLGHIGEKGLQSLQNKSMVEDMSKCNSNFDFYKHCIYGKQNRVKFPSGATRAKEILELIHSDVFGPVPVPSLGGAIYYVSFIDDFSRNTSMYFLKKKSEVFSKFKEVKALVETKQERK